MNRTVLSEARKQGIFKSVNGYYFCNLCGSGMIANMEEHLKQKHPIVYYGLSR